jgi:hypothetical protein
MAEPTIQDIFGAGATQTATTITILKADLPFTALATNNGEQVMAAIVKKAGTVLTQTAFDADPDRSIVAASGTPQLLYRTVNNALTTLLGVNLTFTFAQPLNTPAIAPDSY